MVETCLTRRARFSAAHRYWRPEWDEARNRAAFGACANPHGHGHNYLLEVTVHGRVDPETGFCVDLAVLDSLIQREVIEPLDHRHLNHAVPEFMEGERIPSSENLLLYLWPRLAAGIPAPARLHRLRLSEDDMLTVEYSGGMAR
jgi:6-pyruvoyltetrahydropterin/6-carboxytetrahydropterin synthase